MNAKLNTPTKKGNKFRNEHFWMPRDVHILEYKSIKNKPKTS